MSKGHPGSAVCWWKVHPGKEKQFSRGWRRGTELIREINISLGAGKALNDS